jgi:hypothetical protein
MARICTVHGGIGRLVAWASVLLVALNESFILLLSDVLAAPRASQAPYLTAYSRSFVCLQVSDVARVALYGCWVRRSRAVETSEG